MKLEMPTAAMSTQLLLHRNQPEKLAFYVTRLIHKASFLPIRKLEVQKIQTSFPYKLGNGKKLTLYEHLTCPKS